MTTMLSCQQMSIYYLLTPYSYQYIYDPPFTQTGGVGAWLEEEELRSPIADTIFETL